MAPNRRSRGARRSQATRNLARKLGRIQAKIKGSVLSPPADPPRFTQIPWNTIIINDEPTLSASINQKVYTAKTLSNIFISQIGLTTTTELSFRLTTIQVWNLSGNPVNLEVNDFTIGFGTNDFIVQVEDTPGRNRWARIGYNLPASQQLIAFNSTDTEQLFKVGCSAGDKLQVRCRLLWKPRVNTTPNARQTVSSLHSRITQLEKYIDDLRLGTVLPVVDPQTSSTKEIFPPRSSPPS